jgi:hypothetical protein
MKKLLFVLLAPVLILGVMGCGETIDPAIQTDYLMQGSWKHAEKPYILVITPDTITVKYIEVSEPYRTEFSYAADRTATKVSADITMFAYKDKSEIAIFRADVDATDPEAVTLKISQIEWSVDEFYYNLPFPPEGTYESLAAADDGSGGGTKEAMTTPLLTAGTWAGGALTDQIEGAVTAPTLAVDGAGAIVLSYQGPGTATTKYAAADLDTLDPGVYKILATAAAAGDVYNKFSEMDTGKTLTIAEVATVKFKIKNPTKAVGAGDIDDITQDDDYSYTVEGRNYNWALPTVELELGSRTLGEFSKVFVDYISLEGDSTYKDIVFMAGALPSAGGFGNTHASVVGKSDQIPAPIGSTTRVAIDIGTSTLTGDVTIAFWINGTSPIKYSISNIRFVE